MVSELDSAVMCSLYFKNLVETWQHLKIMTTVGEDLEVPRLEADGHELRPIGVAHLKLKNGDKHLKWGFSWLV